MLIRGTGSIQFRIWIIEEPCWMRHWTSGFPYVMQLILRGRGMINAKILIFNNFNSHKFIEKNSMLWKYHSFYITVAKTRSLLTIMPQHSYHSFIVRHSCLFTIGGEFASSDSPWTAFLPLVYLFTSLRLRS